jgi:hypothetical protein
MDVRTVTEAEAARMVEHVWSMSFNYGPVQSSQGGYASKLEECERRYDDMFPEGIGALLEKLGR